MTKRPLSWLRRELAIKLETLDQILKPAFEEEPPLRGVVTVSRHRARNPRCASAWGRAEIPPGLMEVTPHSALLSECAKEIVEPLGAKRESQARLRTVRLAVASAERVGKQVFSYISPDSA
jgi:hypothetical protein